MYVWLCEHTFVYTYLRNKYHEFHASRCYVALADCLLVETGTAQNSAGMLQVIVNGEIVSSGNKNKVYKNGEVVVDKCFSSLDKVEVRNPSNDAWMGSISASRDGKGSYHPFTECSKCIAGSASAEEAIVVGGASSASDKGKTACSKHAACELHFFTGLP